MEPVVIEVLRRRAARGGDRFEVLGDGGAGPIDRDRPLTDAPVAFWQGLPDQRGHLLDGHLAGLHLDNVVPDGHLSGPHLAAEHLWPAAVLTFATRPLYFGEFQFAAGAVDAVGNVSDELSPVVRRVVNASPRPARSLAKSAFDQDERRLTFTLRPSPDLHA
jgi:hypothetical protein